MAKRFGHLIHAGGMVFTAYAIHVRWFDAVMWLCLVGAAAALLNAVLTEDD
jgi:hypothetical protein